MNDSESVKIAGLSHLRIGELGGELGEELVVPSGAFKFALHGAF